MIPDAAMSAGSGFQDSLRESYAMQEDSRPAHEFCARIHDGSHGYCEMKNK